MRIRLIPIFSFLFLATLAPLTTTSASAANAVECFLQGNWDDWKMTIRSDFSMATYQDGQRRIALKLTRITDRAQYSDYHVYGFTGRDGRTRIEFDIEPYRMIATLTDYTRPRRPARYEFYCTPTDKNDQDWRPVQEALSLIREHNGDTSY